MIAVLLAKIKSAPALIETSTCKNCPPMACEQGNKIAALIGIASRFREENGREHREERAGQANREHNQEERHARDFFSRRSHHRRQLRNALQAGKGQERSSKTYQNLARPQRVIGKHLAENLKKLPQGDMTEDRRQNGDIA